MISQRLRCIDRKLLHVETLCESYMEAAVRIFGKEAFWNRIKFHVPTHLRKIITDHGDPNAHDESQVCVCTARSHVSFYSDTIVRW